MGYDISYFSCYCGKKKSQKQFKEGLVLAHSLRAPSIMVDSHGCRGTLHLQTGNNSWETEPSVSPLLTVSPGSQAMG